VLWGFPQDVFVESGGVNWILVTLRALFSQLEGRDSHKIFLFACVTRNRGFLMSLCLSYCSLHLNPDDERRQLTTLLTHNGKFRL